MINLEVRAKNKTFWITVIPIIILLVTQIADLFGIQIDLTDVQDKILNLIAIIFLLLGALGVVNDPTTDSLSDSEQAMKYDIPKKDDISK